jgi:hypothetical protein
MNSAPRAKPKSQAKPVSVSVTILPRLYFWSGDTVVGFKVQSISVATYQEPDGHSSLFPAILNKRFSGHSATTKRSTLYHRT